MLSIQNLHVNIDEREVLKGINLYIEEGSTFILFGLNGSGKTTLLMTLTSFANYEVRQAS
ncbi:ATP-binding cassette domain-containing protein, partial [Oceanidesulfovibrio marinus]